MLQRRQFGIYAIIVSKTNDALLATTKANWPYHGLIDLPGGRLESGETWQAALERKVLEKTACRLASSRLLRQAIAIFDYRDEKTGLLTRLHHSGIFYVATTDDEPARSGDEEDAAAALWMPFSACRGDGVTPFVRLARRFIKELNPS